MSIRILADRNIPYATDVFSQFGEVELASGREISPALVRETDLLVVRSVTRVGPALLQGSKVRFVGTATIGVDHIDLDYLKSQGIAFADAAGSNANSVAEYVTAALCHLEESLGLSFAGKTMAVVGVGNVGTKVVEKSGALGMKVLQNDPPREEREGPKGFSPLSEALREADVLTLHTPLTREGDHPTYHLIGSKELASLKKGAFLFNTSRGAVAEGQALLDSLQSGLLGGAVLDVWEGEPNPDVRLVSLVSLGTPHIAGYSFDGKVKGTQMMAEAIACFLGKPLAWPEGLPSPPENPVIRVTKEGREGIREAVLRACPIREDHKRMQPIAGLPGDQRSSLFDRLRKEYPIRREFSQYLVQGDCLSIKDRKEICNLGFRIGDTP
jgi:erythronate-4-phosphate dehydrogenase